MGYQKKIEALEEKSQCGINALTIYSCRTQFCLASHSVLQFNLGSMGSLYLLRRAVGSHLAAWVETELIRVQQEFARHWLVPQEVND